MVQSFENAGYAQSVSRTRDGLTGGFQLLIDIRRFHSRRRKSATADIDFVAKIVIKDGKIIAASTFQATAPAKGSDAQAYVDAFDEAFAKLMTDLVDWTTTTLASEPPPPRRARGRRAEPPAEAVGGRPRRAPTP